MTILSNHGSRFLVDQPVVFVLRVFLIAVDGTVGGWLAGFPLDPVSYTQLDVYKRQVMLHPIIIIENFRTTQISGSCYSASSCTTANYFCFQMIDMGVYHKSSGIIYCFKLFPNGPVFHFGMV